MIIFNGIKITRVKNVAIMEFSPGHRHNPFSGERMDLLKDSITKIISDEKIGAIILYGGVGKSFSVGGDFNEVSIFRGGKEVEDWIDSVNNVYKRVLQSTKPVIAAIDNYAIGFGLQLALTCDYRIGSDICELKMPEFAMGISCNFGGYMLEKFVNRSVMQSMIFDCEGVKGPEAKTLGLLHEVVDSSALLDRAIFMAKKFASYPALPVKETKYTINREIIAGLDEICALAKQAHCKSFADGAAQHNMCRILKRN